MAQKKHLLLTILGSYRDASLASESWVSTLRLALVFGAVDPVGVFPDNWDPVATTINRTETDWTITGNWSVDGPGTETFAPDDFLNDQVAPAVATWAGRAGASDIVRVDALKLSPIGAPDGRLVPAAPYTSGTPCLLTWTSAGPQGPSSANMLPLQNALVASHRSGQPGRHGRGRMFLPGLTVTRDGRFGQTDSTLTTDWANAQKALLDALTYTAGGLTAFHTAPVVTGKPFSNYGTITQVIVNSKVDTQRRRTKRMASETTVTVTV